MLRRPQLREAVPCRVRTGKGFARGQSSSIDIYRVKGGGCLRRKPGCSPLDTKVLYVYNSGVICKSHPFRQRLSLVTVSVYHLSVHSFVYSFGQRLSNVCRRQSFCMTLTDDTWSSSRTDGVAVRATTERVNGFPSTTRDSLR